MSRIERYASVLVVAVALVAVADRAVASVDTPSVPPVDRPEGLADGPVAEAQVFLFDATNKLYEMPGYKSLYDIPCTRERENRVAYNLSARWASACQPPDGWQPRPCAAEVIIVYGRFEHFKVEGSSYQRDDESRTARLRLSN